MQDDEYESGEFVPMTVMPSSRLNDIVLVLQTKTPGVVNVDAILPAKSAGDLVFKSILYLMPSSVRTLSIRFNSLSAQSISLLAEWLVTNDYLECLYIMGCGIEDKDQERLESAWKKNLCGHRRENMGCTFIRVQQSVMKAYFAAEEENK